MITTDTDEAAKRAVEFYERLSGLYPQEVYDLGEAEGYAAGLKTTASTLAVGFAAGFAVAMVIVAFGFDAICKGAF